MMFSDEEIKEIPESTFMRSDDEIISIREVCLSDKFDKKDLGFNSESLLSNSGRNYLEASRSLFRDGFFPEGLDPQQARFAWTEEDGNIASLVSEPGFGTTGQTTFGKDLDAAFKSELKGLDPQQARFAWTEEDGNIASLVSEPGFGTTGQTTFGKDFYAAFKSELKEADTSSSVTQSTSRSGLTFIRKPYTESQIVTSTSTSNGTNRKNGQGARKVDKTDPRSRFHFVKYVKRHGRTVKLWECGICSREFQHQYTLMRHLPTHTDERNFHCDACGKSFRQLSTLSQHRAIHSAERPYTCEVCNKTFNRVSTLISHRKTHSDEKPYKCHICPKGFHQKGNLRNHLFTHTNERPYRCNICLKGFNQQSNLVCHKNKAHSDDGCSTVSSRRNSLRLTQPATAPSSQPDSSRSSADHCEVSSTVGPYLPSIEGPSSSWGTKWIIPKAEPGDMWGQDGSWGVGSGVIVDPIKTYHMGVALATKQTPFALLKPDNGTPVLVKVIDTKLPGGKQMLVPATAEDLKIGGKIVLKSDDSITPDVHPEPSGSAVQIRVPVVATVIPKLQPGGRLHLAVEEPHHAYHTALSADIGEVKVEPCSSKLEQLSVSGCADPLPRLTPLRPHDNVNVFDDSALRPAGSRLSASCSLPPPAPSPPLDFIPMDLFEPMECIPLGPQITAVGNIDQPPPSDDSDIFIGEFEESIPLSDTD